MDATKRPETRRFDETTHVWTRTDFAVYRRRSFGSAAAGAAGTAATTPGTAARHGPGHGTGHGYGPWHGHGHGSRHGYGTWSECRPFGTAPPGTHGRRHGPLVEESPDGRETGSKLGPAEEDGRHLSTASLEADRCHGGGAKG